jgi:AcrR family transcriptional regulator
MTAARSPATSTVGGRGLDTAMPGDLVDSDREPRPLKHDRWLRAGFAILAEGGPKALTIPALCCRVGANSSSFQRNFGGMRAYRAALARSWATSHDAECIQFARIGTRPPRERLSLITATLTSRHHWLLERAMREWARQDALIAASVRAADQRVVDAMVAAFLDAGFDPIEADLRANATFAAGVGFLHLSGSTPNPRAAALREPFIDLLLQQPGPPVPSRLEQS